MPNSAPPQPSGAPVAPWQVRLLGGVQAQGPAGTVTRWPSRACAALLARLALQPARAHPREELIELLWPGVAPDTGRARLRQTLSTLRGLLETGAGAQPGLLVADRQTVRVNADALACDAVRFEQLAASGAHDAARAVYGGALMPGHYDDWIVAERDRLAGLFESLPRPAGPGAGPAHHGAQPLVATRPAAAGAARATAVAVPTAAAAAPPRLPAYWTRAFGQEDALRDLCAGVQSHRLLTLVGPGGTGKTRLAVAAAREMLQAQAQAQAQAQPQPQPQPRPRPRSQPEPEPELEPELDPQPTDPAQPVAPYAPQSAPAACAFERVVFAPMFDVVTPAQLWTTLALLLAATGPGDARAQVTAVLARQPALLVLDNVEQFDADCAQALVALLSEAPDLHLLLTSRRRLGLPGEQLQELAGLLLPPALPPGEGAAARSGAALADIAVLEGNPAVSLFVDRARESRPEFRLTAQTAGAVAGLVRLLGGMPLAIELAASRLRALGPRELLARLSQDAGTPLLDLLARPGAAAARVSASSRHASMRHVMDWSWQQLAEQTRALLQAMSIFAQPADATLVAQAWAGLADADAPPGAVPEVPTAPVQALLADALEASMVTRSGAAEVPPDDDDGPARYALLQPVREYAAEQLGARRAAAVRTRVRRWLIGHARLCAARGHEGIADVQAQMPQICAAIMQGVQDGAPAESAQLAVALRRHWEIDIRAAPPMAVVEALRTAQPQLEDPALRCQTCLLLCISLLLAGDVEAARGYANTALAAAPDERLRAQSLMRLAGPLHFSKAGGPTQDEIVAEAIALARRVGDVETEALATRNRFLLLCNRDRDYVRAEAVAHRVQDLWESLGHRRNAYLSLMDRASCWIQRGLYEQAVGPLAECERVAREERFPTGYIMPSWQLGRALMRLRRGPEALAAFQRCLRDSWQEQRMAYVADALLLLPGGLALCGRDEAAALLQAHATPHWQRHFGALYREVEREVTRTRRLLRQRLGPARLAALGLQGNGLTLAQAVGLGLAG